MFVTYDFPFSRIEVSLNVSSGQKRNDGRADAKVQHLPSDMTRWSGFSGVWVGISHTSDLWSYGLFLQEGHDWLASAESSVTLLMSSSFVS